MIRIALALLLVAVVAHLPSSAVATSTSTVYKDIDVALDRQSEDRDVYGEGALVIDKAVVLAGEFGEQVRLGLPAEIETVTKDGINLYSGVGKDNEIAVQPTSGGVRALIHIDSEDAPERYDFPLSGDVGELKLQPDGSVIAFNLKGKVVGQIAVPWAYDNTGRAVPTHYEINGITLTQVVRHRSGHYQYGIVADPFWNDAWRAVAKMAKHGTKGDLASLAAAIVGIDGVKGACF